MRPSASTAYATLAVLVSLSVFVSAAPVTLTAANSTTGVTCQRAGKHGKLHLISGGDVRVWTESVRFNHQAFAQRHGYTYQFVEGNAAEPRLPYWSKVKLLLDALSATDNDAAAADWFLWVDDDIVFTALDSEMIVDWQDELVREGKVLSVTRDSADFTVLNTGMILVRSTRSALQLLRDLWANGEGFLSRCPQSRCLHEQQALRNMHEFGRTGSPDYYKKLMLIVPQRRPATGFNMNTFHRMSHFDECRGVQQEYHYDTEDSRWAEGAFTCHVTGMNPHLRAQLLAQCLDHAHGPGGYPDMPSMADLDACGRPITVAAGAS